MAQIIRQARYDITCPRCGQELVVHNSGEPVEGGTAVNAILRCTNKWCHTEWGLHIRLMPTGTYTDEGDVHGNRLAYNRHKRAGEPQCDECKLWHMLQQREDNELVSVGTDKRSDWASSGRPSDFWA